jgi:glycosyltransferase involved in cell wall biosynthesis/CelD/BcsL family acetyltransferase involved in cellulose biosynthesis
VEIRVLNELGTHREEWDALVDAMPLPSPFLRSWWLEHAAVGEPTLVLCLEQGRLVGGLALQRTVRGGCDWFEVLGEGPLSPDHVDLLAAAGREAEVSVALRTWMDRRGSRVFRLRGVTDHSMLADVVPGVGPVRMMEVAPYAQLPASYDEYYRSMPGMIRSLIKSTTKKFDKYGITVQLQPFDDVDASLATLASLHDSRWGDASGFMAGWDQFVEVARAASKFGEARFSHLVDFEGRVLASEFEFGVAGRLSYYQSGRLTDYDLRGSGSVLRAQIVERGIEEGFVEFDFMRGDEPYKRDWINSRRSLFEIRRGVGSRGVAMVGAAELNREYQDRVVVPRLTRRAEVREKATGRDFHLAVVMDANALGGAEVALGEMLGALPESVRVSVIAADHPETEAVLTWIGDRRPAITSHLIPQIAGAKDVRGMLAHRRLLASLKPDIIHLNLSVMSVAQWATVAALSLPKVPVVAVENSSMGTWSRPSAVLKHVTSVRLDGHVAVGDRTARIVEEHVGLPDHSVRRIYNGVRDVRRTTGERHGDGFSVINIARHDPVKGVDVLVSAMALLPDDVHLVQIGGGPQREALLELRDSLGLQDRVTFEGDVWETRPADRIADHDLFVLPSRLEGLPMTVMEAMLAGLPIVATDVGSVREAVRDGETGLVVPPGDPEALASAIVALRDDPERRREMGMRARRIAEELFTAQSTADAYAELYAELLERGVSLRTRLFGRR